MAMPSKTHGFLGSSYWLGERETGFEWQFGKEAILLLTKFKNPTDSDNLGCNDSLLNNETNVSLAPGYETNVSLV
jgi:hypothetical protein